MKDRNALLERMTLDAAAVEEHLKKCLSPQEESYLPLFEAMRYSTLGGGKRIRAFLTLAFCRLLARDVTPALPFASAMEMMHAFSLIHDDLPCMDNDSMRRGKPSCHVAFGEAGALLAGDALMILSVETASRNEYVRKSTALTAVRDLTAFAGRFGMAGGQQLDLIGETEALDYDTLLSMHARKTGALIKAACRLGCYASDRYDEKSIGLADAYAEKIGLVFQIVDDVLDVTADEKKLGKHTGKDKESGKTTFLSFMTVDEALSRAGELTRGAQAVLPDGPQGVLLSDFAEWLLTRDR